MYFTQTPISLSLDDDDVDDGAAAVDDDRRCANWVSPYVQ